jgi:integrase
MDGNIYKRGSTWYGRVWVGGKEHRRSLHTADESEARREVEAWRTELAGRADGGKGSDPTWRQAVVNWAETIGAMSEEDGLKANVKKRYVESIRMVDHLWGKLRLSQIGRPEIAEFVKARKRGFVRPEPDGTKATIKPVTNATVRRDLTALSSVFRAAVAAGLTDYNPPRLWDRSVIKERKRVFVPPLPHEVDAVLAYATGHFKKLIEFAAKTGVRQKEAVGIEWRDVRGDGEVLLPRTKVSRPRVVRLKTPGGDATGTVTGTTRHIRSGLLFWHGIDGEAFRNAAGQFREVMARAVAGEAAEGRTLRPFRFHDLRHAFAVRWLLAGGDIYALSKHLGHTSVKTTEIYLAYVADFRDAMTKPEPAQTGHNPSVEAPHTLAAANG